MNIIGTSLIIPWEKPWIASGNCVAHTTGKPYSLLNQMLLGRPGEYITFNQCQKEGGRVKKGEKSHMVVFWKWIEQEDEETGEKKEIPFLRYYNVFHIDQCEGISPRHTETLHMPDGAEAIEEAQEIIYDYLGREGVKLLHTEGDRAYYKHYPSFASGQMNVSELARICGLSRPTVYKYLKMVG